MVFTALAFVVAALGMTEVVSGMTPEGDTVTHNNARVTGVWEMESYHEYGRIMIRTSNDEYRLIYVWKNSEHGVLGSDRGSRLMSIVSSSRYNRFDFRYVEQASPHSDTYLRYNAGSELIARP